MKNLSLLLTAAVLTQAQTLSTIRVSSETVPPGGMAQVKVLLTSPQPITGGGVKFAGALSTADGISLYSPTGDVFGVAVQNGRNVDVRFVSPNGTFGTNLDYPVLTVTFKADQNAVPGQTSVVTLGADSLWQSLFGPVPVELKPGVLTIGGSVSITNVLPGGGAMPAGATFRIEGIGFTPKTKVSLSGATASAITYVSPTAIDVTLKAPTVMDGVAIRVKNPDNSDDTYYSYLRGVNVGRSANPLVAGAVPVFSTKTTLSAVLPPLILPQFNSPYVVGVAVQNPGREPANITLELDSASGAALATVGLTLGPGNRMSRELSELFGVAVPSGAQVRLKSTGAVQVLGLLGKTTDGSVVPMAFAFN